MEKLITCRFCESVVPRGHVGQKYCSPECSHLDRRKFHITKRELKKLVWKMPTCRVAKLLDVSDKAVEKRCRALGIEKPPRGYSRQVETSGRVGAGQ